MVDLKNKRIVIFSPCFFGYESKIKAAMEKMGAKVSLYDTRPSNAAWFRAVIKFFPDIFKKYCDRYYKKILEQQKNKEIDYLLIIKCDLMSIDILKYIKKEFAKTKICLYLWDSMKDIPGIESKIKYFDVVNSFDDDDCASYPEIGFRPLFFCDEFRKNNRLHDYKYDVSFCGTVHTNRLKIINKIEKQVKSLDKKIYCYLYLQSQFIYLFYWITKKDFRKVRKDIFDFDKISSRQVSEIVNESNAILDIQSPGQKGLTMRTVEILGMGKKLITTNENINKYDFYNSDNICIVELDNPCIDQWFLKKTYREIDSEVYEKYSITTWVQSVFNKCEIKEFLTR